MEYKEFDIKVLEVKQEGDKGKAVIVLSPFNNVDYGDDRVMPTISNRNDGKRIPLLLGHETETEHGHLDMFSDKSAIKSNVELYLEKTEEGIPIFPEAHKHYALLKRAEADAGVTVKYSIGYNTIDFEYVTEGKKTIRNLKDIDIMEGSRVTFPMNPKAENVPGSVKNNGGVKMEEKALGFKETLELRNAQEMRWKLQDALNASTYQLINDEGMTEEAKLTQLKANVAEFGAAYEEAMTVLVKASAKNAKQKKSILDSFETKSKSVQSEQPTQQPEEKTEGLQEPTEDDTINQEFKNGLKTLLTKMQGGK